jgi:hypothetical protein
VFGQRPSTQTGTLSAPKQLINRQHGRRSSSALTRHTLGGERFVFAWQSSGRLSAREPFGSARPNAEMPTSEDGSQVGKRRVVSPLTGRAFGLRDMLGLLGATSDTSGRHHRGRPRLVDGCAPLSPRRPT